MQLDFPPSDQKGHRDMASGVTMGTVMDLQSGCFVCYLRYSRLLLLWKAVPWIFDFP